jgi:hypothetical protein
VPPENAASAVAQPGKLTPENAELLAEYAGHLQRSPLTGHSPRTYLGAIRAYLAWLQDAPVDGDPLNDAAAKDWAVRDYRSYLVTVAKRATATVNKHLAALQDFYVWRGLGPPQGVRRDQVPRHAPKALAPRAKLRYLRAVEAWPGARDRAIALLPLYAGTPHRRDPRPGRRRRAAERPQGRDRPGRQGRENPDRARAPQAPRGAGRLAGRASRRARRGPSRPVHLGPGHPDDH